MRILLVEDDYILGSSLKRALEKHAYGLDWFRDAETALDALRDSQFGCVILDVNLPKASGFDVARSLRRGGNDVPILMLTALDSVRDRVAGLDEGADDYLVKPFDLDELLARLRALIRRRQGRTETIIRCADVELDPSAMVARRNGVQLHIPAKEFHLLRLLMERSGRYVTKNDIEYALYDTDVSVESNTIEVTVYNLRKKLGTDFIRSIRGVGYMVERQQ
ncbi:response regulator transcription factor (plasmid) [Sinorhizobium sp. B11]|uniref:response regulator transcription factor n=1 Tax=unclassified Rhizobium TaxID=2613769 RepID=UPI000DD77DD5|nr:response regulator transcription factor [Rhizobium sp. BK512]MBB3443837.1 two-component system OmpR family response regulator/two-component system response regulator QseB [Rhizobium sp. BK379]MBB3562723.1 two-component system OmpR family response regulator/two-component system response regulator QseB [Rhizobium sp. BK512]